MSEKVSNINPSTSRSDSGDEVRQQIRESQKGNLSARNELVENNTRLVWSIVQKFSNRGYELDDLFQIGCIGLIKSIDNFNLDFDVKFSTYAVPMIVGEIQRFIRDDGSVKISRSIKELGGKIRRANDAYEKINGRAPTIKQLSELLNVEEDDIILALEAGRTLTSIHETVYENEGDSIMLIDQISDKKKDNWFENIALSRALETLDKRDRSIIYLRYYKDQTQSEVAERLGVSQVQISRLEKKILKEMCRKME